MGTAALIESMKQAQAAASEAERAFLLDQGWEEQLTTEHGTTWWHDGNRDHGSEPQRSAVPIALQNLKRAEWGKKPESRRRFTRCGNCKRKAVCDGGVLWCDDCIDLFASGY